MNGIEKRELPWWQKYTLTLNEALEYFGIGYKKLRCLCRRILMRILLFWEWKQSFDQARAVREIMDSQMNVI